MTNPLVSGPLPAYTGGMADHRTHDGHTHTHGAGCGHTAVRHDDHTDYLHDGHLHRDHAGHVDECSLGSSHPAVCTPAHSCGGHAAGHTHAAGCSHEAVPHQDHVDYLVGGHLHYPHGGHCDDHGAVATA